MSEPRYHPLSVPELESLELPEREDVVDGGLLVAGSVTLLSAREKSGKTLLCTDLACAIVCEQPFLDRAVTCGPVIFVALEENIREVRQRFLDRLGPRRDVPLFVLPANGFSEDVFRLDHPASLGMLDAMIREYGASVVIVDTMREAHRLRENEADDMSPLMRPLRQSAHDTNCAILFLHHQNKNGTSRGSTAIAAGVDQLWGFQRTDGADESGSPVGKLTVEGRFGPRQVIGIRLGDGLRWRVDDSITLTDQTMRGRVLATIRHGSVAGMTAQAVADHLDARLKTVQNELSRILHEAPCPLIVSGTGKRNDPRRYAVIDPELFPDAHPGDGVWEQSSGTNDDASTRGQETGYPYNDGQNNDCSQGSGNHGNKPNAFVPKFPSLGVWELGINDDPDGDALFGDADEPAGVAGHDRWTS